MQTLSKPTLWHHCKNGSHHWAARCSSCCIGVGILSQEKAPFLLPQTQGHLVLLDQIQCQCSTCRRCKGRHEHAHRGLNMNLVNLFDYINFITWRKVCQNICWWDRGSLFLHVKWAGRIQRERLRISTITVSTSIRCWHPVAVVLVLTVGEALHTKNTGGILTTVSKQRENQIIFAM